MKLWHFALGWAALIALLLLIWIDLKGGVKHDDE